LLNLWHVQTISDSIEWPKGSNSNFWLISCVVGLIRGESIGDIIWRKSQIVALIKQHLPKRTVLVCNEIEIKAHPSCKMDKQWNSWANVNTNWSTSIRNISITKLGNVKLPFWRWKDTWTAGRQLMASFPLDEDR